MNYTRTYTLRVLTPLHIGDGKVLYRNLDFVTFGEKIFVLDEHKLTEALQAYNLLTDFSNEFIEKGRDFSLATFLSRAKLHNESFYSSIAQYTILSDRSRNPTVQANELRTFIKTHNHRPYIPGSSIKGALRIGMLYTLLKKQPEIRKKLVIDHIERELNGLARLSGREASKKRSYLRKNLGRNLDVLLNSFKLPMGKQGPNTDILRVWEIHDSPELHADSLTITEVEVLKTNGEPSTHITVETLKPGTTIPLSISINHTLYERFASQNQEVNIQIPRGRDRPPIMIGSIPFSDYKELILNPLKGTEILTNDLIRAEKQNLRAPAFKHALPVEHPNLRLGWGQGLLSTTVFLLLPDDLRKRVRNELFQYRGNAPAPWTRKLTSQNQLLGFCRIEPHEA